MAKENKKLTEKQEAFVIFLVSGYSKHDAYIKAYPKAKNWDRKIVDIETHKMLNKPHIKARYEELYADYIEHVKKQAYYDRDQLLNDFIYLKDESKKSIELNGVRQANSNAYINALKNIGEILSLYPDKRLDINANVSSDFEINIINGDNDDETDDKHK